uniref:Uncharacterized protein n=1 Tax=Branchiostoma floridae TaxID=7739 RepID=C3Z5W8_BRAFL|eukprot:XP_002596219.1 hypothetical protein BRAFLDRAFT_66033 [Branchiostoma floridae]
MLSLHSVPGRAAGTPRGRLTSRVTTETEQSGKYPREHAWHVILAREESPTVYVLARGRRGWARGKDTDDGVTRSYPRPPRGLLETIDRAPGEERIVSGVETRQTEEQ